MNILENIKFNTAKPAVLSILKSDKINYMAIGLFEGQVLQKHKANIPTMLTVLHGSVEFHINGETTLLNTFDTFNIPVSIEHEVRGIESKNLFTLIQQK